MLHYRLLGVTCLISGMAIGAGMLAIPMATAELGFIKILFLMFGCWALMATSALVLLQVTLQFDKDKNSFSQMAYATLGRGGQIVMYITFLAFIYALISAYLSGGSSMISNFASYLFDLEIPHTVSGILFLCSLGSVIYFGTQAVDQVNQWFFSAQMLFFVLLCTLFVPHIHTSYLFVNDNSLWVKAAPVVLTSFGFHLCIPALVTYMGDEAPKLKYPLLIGSFIPLIVYAVWVAMILGTVPLQGEMSFAVLREKNASIGELIVMMNHMVDSHTLRAVLSIFSNLALITSFLGVSLSLFDFWNKNIREINPMKHEKIISFLLTFIPPALFLFVFPNGFERALAYGSLFEVILCIALPVVMAFSLRRVGGYP